jgi:hypothetical protein
MRSGGRRLFASLSLTNLSRILSTAAGFYRSVNQFITTLGRRTIVSGRRYQYLRVVLKHLLHDTFQYFDNYRGLSGPFKPISVSRPISSRFAHLVVPRLEIEAHRTI